MKKIVNDVNNVEEEMIQGLVKSAPKKLRKLDYGTIVVRADKKEGKVALVSGGGSDAAYTTRMGIPTVCSIGPCGWDVHTVRERSDIASLPVRAKLVTKVICEL